MVNNATGKYLFICKQGDRWEDDAVETIMAELSVSSQLIFAWAFTNDLDNPKSSERLSTFPQLSRHNSPFQNAFLLLDEPPKKSLCGAFRVSQLKKTTAFRNEFRDYDLEILLHELVNLGEIHITPKVLFRSPTSVANKQKVTRQGAAYYFERPSNRTFFRNMLKITAKNNYGAAIKHIAIFWLIGGRLLARLIENISSSSKLKIKVYRMFYRLIKTSNDYLMRFVKRLKPASDIALLRLKSTNADMRSRYHFYSKFISPGDLCLDIGANIGNRTEILLDLGAQVIAVEPQISCAKILKRRFSKDPKVTIVQKGLASSEGYQNLWLCNETTTRSTMSDDWILAVDKSKRFKISSWGKKIAVPVTTLDRLISEYGTPKFCKIDVEGFEYEVLRGLSQRIEIISFEFTYPEFFEDALKCMQHLISLGKVRFNISIGESMQMLNDEWVSAYKIEQQIALRMSELEFGDIYAHFN